MRISLSLLLLPVLLLLLAGDVFSAGQGPLQPGQARFGNGVARFGTLVEQAQRAVRDLPPDCRVGIAPHSLRATAPSELTEVLAAHPDDEVLGCGGTIAKLVDEGATVHVAFLADGVFSRGQTPRGNAADHRPPGGGQRCLVPAIRATMVDGTGRYM